MSLCKGMENQTHAGSVGRGLVCWAVHEAREHVVGAAAGRQGMRILEHEAKELGHHPEALGTHERALRSGGLFSRHSRKMHREEEQEDQSEADESPSSLDQHGVIETRGVDSWAPCRDAEGGRDWSQRQSEGWVGDGE